MIQKMQEVMNFLETGKSKSVKIHSKFQLINSMQEEWLWEIQMETELKFHSKTLQTSIEKHNVRCLINQH
jgi:hypothetical protein